MRVLVISDIHANLTALEAVLKDAGPVDETWCLGDLVGYGPDPNECVERVAGLPNLTCLLGNHDAAVLGQIDLEAFNRDAQLSAQWMRSTLNSAGMRFLIELPQMQLRGDVTLSHGSPRNPVWEYLLDLYTASQSFDYFSTPYCFVGHTHLPLSYIKDTETGNIQWAMLRPGDSLQLNGRTIVNPGSVGQPRDHDPRAAYAIYLPEEKRWEPHRVEYDIFSVQQRITKYGLPRRHAMRLAEGW